MKAILGEEAIVNPDAKNACITQSLPHLLERYSAENVYNAGETGLFFQMIPNKTLAFKGDKCIGGKVSKACLTVMLCANMAGTDKGKLLIIGKSEMYNL